MDLFVTCEPSQRSDQPAGAVAIIASAGGIAALISLLRALPDTFPVPIFVAQHLAPLTSELDKILSRTWALEAAQPRGGHVYLVPPGMRLAVTAAGFQL